MDMWIKSLTAIQGQGRSKTACLRVILPVLLQSLAIYYTYRAIRWCRKRRGATDSSALSSPDIEPAQDNLKRPNRDREPGVWIPLAFEYPEVAPCPLPIRDVKPVPYRPFRWGEYHVTMGIRTMPWSEWMELDESFLFHQRIRTFRVSHCGKTVLRVLPAREDESVKVAGGAEAVKELLYELAEYLPQRYPRSFRISRLPASAPAPSIGGIPLSWHGKTPVKTIEVVETGEKYDLGVLETMNDVAMGEEAFRIINHLMQDDIAMMIEGTDRKYYFQAGLICVPGFWRMRDKIGMPLDEIHLSGEVPQFKEKLQVSMNRFFQRLPVDKPVIRNNYSIQVVQPRVLQAISSTEETLSNVDPEELSWSESLNGLEADFTHGRGHGTKEVPHVSPATLRLRSERQTLRRLPRTGAIVFGIRTYQFKVEELARERGVAARLASAVRSWPEDVASFKGRRRYRDVLLGFLDECAEKDGVTGPIEGMLPFPY
ncbi:hypothetical protein JVT61DRAFT_6792 [Boletus reticuloceps]|uniref:Uncharacterized protein n=1 Tax=Boletus reticuloceps TaxID=495285 RepID=A0A8I2YIZ6_9AGAM|nr:hypothetical protein JVT61DRAFT_6792 [Boletus reticuloceps]